MQGNQKNVDAAQMQRQIGRFVVSADAQHDNFEQLITYQQTGHDPAHFGTARRLLFPIQQTAAQGKQHIKEQPRQMKGRKVGKTHTWYDRIHRVKKILEQNTHLTCTESILHYYSQNSRRNVNIL